MVKTAKTALPENLSLVFSTHIRWLTTTRNFSFRGSNASSGF